MNEKIQKLVILQQKDSEIDSFDKAFVGISPERDSINEQINSLKTGFEGFKEETKKFLLKKKEMEMDLDSKEEEIKKLQKSLNSMKTNEAYKAALKEIEAAKKSQSEIEDKLLELMESIDSNQKQVKEKEKTFNDNKNKLEQAIVQLNEEEKRLQSELKSKKEDRGKYASGVEKRLLAQYESIRKSKGGTAVVPINGQSCGGCKMSLPPNVINEVRRDHEIVYCVSCARILYINDGAK